MAFEYVNTQSKISLEAKADLSGKQYHFVKLSGNGVVVCSAITDVPIGILQNTPTSGQVAEVAVDGISKLVAGGTLGAGALIGTKNDGRAVALTAGTSTTAYTVGQVIVGGTANGDVMTVTLDAKSPARAA